VRFTVFVATVLGRRIGRFLTLFVSAYYTLTSPRARRGLRAFYTRLEGREPSFARLYRHMLRFVRCTLDAFFLVSGKTKGITVTRTGNHWLEVLRDEKKGAILLGAHVGSFYAMRVGGAEERMP